MSDLRPHGVIVELGEREFELLFTLEVIDEIQEKCNAPLRDVIMSIAEAADGKTDRETLQVFSVVLASLISRNQEEKMAETEVRKIVEIRKYQRIAWAILDAYGISIPDPDGDDEEDEEEENEDPNRKTGQ